MTERLSDPPTLMHDPVRLDDPHLVLTGTECWDAVPCACLRVRLAYEPEWPNMADKQEPEQE